MNNIHKIFDFFKIVCYNIRAKAFGGKIYDFNR